MLYTDKCKGCGLCREYCEKAFTDECARCGKCSAVCYNGARVLCGEEKSVDGIFAVVRSDFDYYEMSGGGVTLSGGEPLLQAEFASELLKKCKENGIHTAIETAGNVPFSVFESVVPYTDLFLYDIKCIDEKLHRELTGASNHLILENAERLKKMPTEIIFRMPFVPGFNDSEVKAVSAFSDNKKLEIMPYHNICSSKYEALGRVFETENAEVPDENEIKRLAEIFPNVIN